MKTTNDTRAGAAEQALTRTVLTQHAMPWSTSKPVVVKVTLPREPWAKPTKEEDDEK